MTLVINQTVDLHVTMMKPIKDQVTCNNTCLSSRLNVKGRANLTGVAQLVI